MNKEQFEGLAKHKVGHSRPMTGAQLDQKFYTPTKRLPPNEWPYKAKVATFRGQRELKPRPIEEGDCLACRGSGWSSSDKGKGTGSLVYRSCSSCGGKGRAE